MLRADEGEGCNLRKSAAEQSLRNKPFHVLLRCALCVGNAAELPVRNVLIAVKTCNFLGDIRLVLNVVSE